MLTALHGDLDTVELLAANGADVNAGMSLPAEGGIPASLPGLVEGKFCMHGSWDVVQILLQAGAQT